MVLGIPPESKICFAYGTITLYGGPFQILRLQIFRPFMVVPRPRTPEEVRFRLLPFRSPLLRESPLISFPLGTEMFHFPRFASLSG